MFVGVDVGSTNIKALFIDEGGQDLWVKSVPSPRRHDGFGVVTDGLELIAALEDLIIEGWRAVGKGKPIAAIATTGIGEDGFCIDGSFRPRGLAIPWFDHRDKAEAEELLSSAEGRAHPWINYAFSTAAAKWLWLHRHRPEAITGNDPWVTLTDWPAVWWARRAFICTTLMPAPASMTCSSGSGARICCGGPRRRPCRTGWWQARSWARWCPVRCARRVPPMPTR